MNPRSIGGRLLIALACVAWFAAIATISLYADTLSLWRTLALGLAACCIAIPTGALLNWLAGHAGWLGRLTTMATIVLLFFPLFLHVSLWDAAFGKLGWLTATRGEVLTPIVSGWAAAAWIHGVAAAPQVAIIFWLRSSIGTQAHEEQASLDAGPMSVLLHIKLRRLLSVSLLAIAWVIVTCSREIAVTDIYQIGTLAEQVYLGYSLGTVAPTAGAWSTDQLRIAEEFQLGPSLIPIGCLCLLFSIGFIQLTSERTIDNAWRPSRRKNVTGRSMSCAVFMLLLLVAIPFANVLYRSGYIVKRLGETAVGSFEIDQLLSSLQRALTDCRGEFFWSTIIAAVTATVIILIASGLVWLATQHRIARWVFILMLAVSLSLPGPLIGTTIAEIFSNVQFSPAVWLYDRTIFAPAIGTIIFCWPLAGMFLWFLFSRVDRQTLHSMQLDGGTPWHLFWQLGIVRNAWAIGGTWLLTFALSFGELSASQLVLPPGMDTLPRLMLGLLHAGVDEMTAAITILIATTIFIVTLFAYGLIAIRLTADNEYERP